MKLIELTQGFFTKVDDEDYEKFSHFKWYVVIDKRNKYKIKARAYRRVMGLNIYLSRQIMNCPKNKQVDHINGITLDNQKENLRICTASENQCNKGKYQNNTLGYKGIIFDKRDGFFYCRIQVNKKRISLGRFLTARDAGIAYDNATIKYHKEFTYLKKND